MINVTMSVDLAPAAASDDIADAVNYRTVAKAIIAHVEQGSPCWWSASPKRSQPSVSPPMPASSRSR